MRCLFLILFVSVLVHYNLCLQAYYDLGHRDQNVYHYSFIFDRPTNVRFGEYVHRYGGLLKIGTRSGIMRKGSSVYLDSTAHPVLFEKGAYTVPAICTGNFACFKHFGVQYGQIVRVVHTNVAPLIIDYETSVAFGLRVQILYAPYDGGKLILDSSKCYTPRYSLQKVYQSEIGMSVDCFNNYQIVKANVTVTTEDDKEYSYLITLTPVGYQLFKTEVEVYPNPVFDVPPPVMPYYIERKMVNGYAVVDVRFNNPFSVNLWGLLLGYKSYMHFTPFKAISIETVDSVNSAACPVVLLIPDMYANEYNSTCQTVEKPPTIVQPPDWWKPFNFNDYNVLYSHRLNSVEFKIKTDGQTLRFLLAVDLPVSYSFSLKDYEFEVRVESMVNVVCITPNLPNSGSNFEKVYGGWAGFDLIPVVVTQDYIRIGSHVCLLEPIPNSLNFSEPVVIAHKASTNFPIIFMPKNYTIEGNSWSKLMVPRSRFQFIPNYHYLQPRLCNGSLEYQIKAEDTLSIFLAFPSQCFNNSTIISGTIGEMQFTLFRNNSQLMFDYGDRNRSIPREDLQRRLGLVMLPVTIYPDYTFIGSTVGSNKNAFNFSNVVLSEDKDSCSFMFILPKYESQLADSLKCVIPPEWSLPQPVSDPLEKLYWIVGGVFFSLMTIIYIGLTCWSLNCCESRPRFKED